MFLHVFKLVIPDSYAAITASNELFVSQGKSLAILRQRRIISRHPAHLFTKNALCASYLKAQFLTLVHNKTIFLHYGGIYGV
jgi:hypothetical protein